MNIYICGQKHFAADVFTALKDAGHTIVGVSSPEFGSDGSSPDRLKALAEAAGVKWMKSGVLNENTIPEGVDLIVTAHSHDFVREPTRNKTTYGAIGYHPSLLPLHRGKDAIIWTIEKGDKITGGSVYWLNEVMDGGPIAAQEHVFVLPGDTPDLLWKRDLQPLGIKLLVQACNDIAQGRIIKKIQNEDIATVEPSIKKFKADAEAAAAAAAAAK
ncbi:MAG: formyltransferase family protein [Oxalicibacterium faecigallinarum]|uniref:formyltransferase family protein n=1 Tax=Oxalicibacterium faecigallinarum TaxID=573741 RepID=UPI0028091FFF|nr:formyltransferase family protein [Oxalicibacterium faecigallinarum]MDQ7969857.1 formyltransferase family protein [Oxalicibacterium faecigallinarum]